MTKPIVLANLSRSRRRVSAVVAATLASVFLLCHPVVVKVQARVTSADRAVLSVMRREARVDLAAIWRRERLPDGNDLVVVRQSFQGDSNEDGMVGMGAGTKLGIFVQEANEPFRVFTIGVPSLGMEECDATLLRVAATDLVFSCAGEKFHGFANQKFLFDSRARRLVGRYQYEPYHFHPPDIDRASRPWRVRLIARSPSTEARFDFVPGSDPEFRLLAVRSVGAENGSAHRGGSLESESFGPGKAFRVAPEPSDVGGGDQPVLRSRINGVTRLYPLPKTPYKEFEAARPDELRMNPHFQFTLGEEIGSFQVVDDKLWFGKTFYNGEGISGVGGIGFFDPVERKFHIFTAPEIAAWSAGSLLVEPDYVWASLGASHEWSSTSGGVVRFNRTSHRFDKVSDTSGRILRVNDDVMLVVGGDLAVIRNGVSRSFFVDQTTGGQPRLVPLLP